MIPTATETNLIQKISNLSVINQIVETIYVGDTIGKIEVSKTIKENNIVRNISEYIEYKLKPHRLIIKNHKNHKNHNSTVIISDLPNSKTIIDNKSVCHCLSSNINNIFISELKSFKSTQKSTYRFFNQGFLMKLFKKNTEIGLVEQIINLGTDCSWAILPRFIFDIIKDSEWFDATNMISESIIFNAGRLDDLNIYVNPDEDESMIYFGNYDSITIIVNKNIKEDELKCGSFHKEGKSIIIEYLFIENFNGITKSLQVI
jgi:hypothetical protein